MSKKARRTPLKWLSDHLHTKENPTEAAASGTETATHRDEDRRHSPPRGAESENPTDEEAAAAPNEVPDEAPTIENPSASALGEPKSEQISFWERATAALAKENGDLRATLEEYGDQADKLAQSLTHGKAESGGEGKEEDRIKEPLSIAEIIAGVAQKQIEDMEYRQWALPAKVSGNETCIRPLLAKILTYANSVKKRADNVMDLDPSGYAKLAWLPFSLVLDLATLDIEQYYAALDAFSDLSLLVYRYKSVEDFYWSQESDTVFEEQLVKLYRMVLECQVALIAHFRRNGLLKFLRAAAGAEDCRRSKASKSKTETVRSFSISLVFLQDNTQKLVDIVNRTEIRKVLQWVGHDPSGERKRILEDSKLDSDFENAGGWLINGDDFQRWSSAEPQNELQPFWIHGPVGCGKTSLTARVIEFFLNRAFRDEQEQVAYFYCNKRNGAGSSVLEVFHSLVRQLAYSAKHMKVDDQIMSLWKGRSSANSDPLTLKECKQILPRLLRESRCTTAFLIDALDECEKPQQLLSEFREISVALQKITVGSGAVRAFMSSRDNVEVSRCFPSCDSVNITPTLVTEDLEYFVGRFVDIQCARGHELGDEDNAAIRQRLVQSVTARGQGNFKWAELQLEYLLDQDPFNPRDLENRLSKMEYGQGRPVLNDAYEQLYRRKTGEDQGEITHVGRDLQRILKWVLACNTHPDISLIVDALRHDNDPGGYSLGQFAKHIDAAYVLRVASNLLVLERRGSIDILQLAHLSVKEYLVGIRMAEYSGFEAHLAVASSCLSCIDIFLGPNDPPISIDPETMPFADYALWNWCLHCAEIGEKGRKQRELEARFANLMRVVPVSEVFARFIRFIRALGEDLGLKDSDENMYAISEAPSPFLIACIWDFAEVVDDVLRQRPDMVDARTIGGHTGLHIAAFQDNERLLRRLVSAGADLNSRDKRKRTPLYTAVSQKNIGIARYLLDVEHLDVNASDDEGRTPLIHAANEEYAELVQLLLQSDVIDINAQTLNGWTALTRAAHRGSSDVVLQLVHSGRELDFNAQSQGRTALHWALERRFHEIADILIAQPSVDVNRKDEDGFPPLVAAAKCSYCGIVRTLLYDRKDLGINAKDGSGVTALGWAVQSEYHDMVRVLLSHPGVHVNVRTAYGGPVLHHAIMNSSQVDTVHLLLGRLDLDINARNEYGESAIFLTIASKKLHVARFILESRSDLDINLEYDFIRIVGDEAERLFLNHPEGDHRKLYGWSILYLAAGLGYSEILGLLLEKFGDALKFNARLAQGDTALHCAIAGASLEALQILLGRTEIDIDATNEDGMTALHLAAESGHLDATRLLIEHGADMHIADDGGSTAEQLATNSGRTEVAGLLRNFVRTELI